MSDQTLSSLAVLTVNWEQGHDVIESFVPLIAAHLPSDEGRPVSAVDLQRELAEKVGIKIPMGALTAMLARCARHGYVRKIANVYHADSAKLATVDFHKTEAEALRKHQCLLDKLRAFAAERYEMEWSEADADRNVLNYLQEGSLSVLYAAIEGDPLPSFRPASRKTRHVISAFALHLSERDPEGFACLETVVKGHVLSGVLFYPSLGEVEARFTELDVYFDTPLVLSALGYAEEGIAAQATDLLDLLRELGAGLKCFHHTREEVVGVLEAIANSKRPGGYQSHDRHFFETNRAFSLSDVEEMIITIDATLETLGVEVVDTPAWTDQPDEAALEEQLGKRINYHRERGREKDAMSLAAVARLRGLRRMDKFERSKAIFVTSNSLLVAASHDFFKETEPGPAIPIGMTDRLMTRLAWVKKPIAAPDVPRHLVMAASYAALNPREELWRRYIEEIERRRLQQGISDEQYHLLRSSREARIALMDQTFGDENAFSAGTVDEVLAHARTVIQGEAQAEVDEARESARQATEQAQLERRTRLRLERAQDGQIGARAHFAGTVAGIAVTVILGAAVILGVLATVPDVELLKAHDLAERILIWLSLAVVLGLTMFAFLVRHLSVSEIRRKLSDRIEHRWQERGHRRLAKSQSRASGDERS